MRSAIMSGAMAIPLEYVHAPTLIKTLTAKHQPMGVEEAILVSGYEMDDEFIYVPRQFGMSYCLRNGIPFEDHTSSGFAVDFPKVPSPRDYQIRPLDDIVAAFDSYYDFIFKAHTGWGKTIGGLITAARLGTTTLIVVDQDNLKDQWLAALSTHFGMTVENGHVGIVQGQNFDYANKSVVIAMVHTISRKDYPQEFYDYFGFILFDEVHSIGAPTFSVVLRMFSAAYRLGVSATPKRKDGLQKLLDYSLGPIRVSADKEHNESAVYIRDHGTVYSWYANISPKVGRMINEVSDDGSRNLLLAESAMALYESGRDTLLLSDRIEQLKHIKSLLYYLGVGDDELGLYAGYDLVMRYAKDPKPVRKPNDLVMHEDGEHYYTPVSLQLIAKRIPKKQLDHVKTNAGMLHATYGMCAKGFDEPRLKAGVDLSPRSEVEQIHGRILREVPGEKMPIWATIRDVNNPRLMFSFAKRISGYLKSNGRLYSWPEDGELTECQEQEVIEDAWRRNKELKSMRIETRKDGRNILVTQRSAKTQERQRAIATVNKVRSRPRG